MAFIGPAGRPDDYDSDEADPVTALTYNPPSVSSRVVLAYLGEDILPFPSVKPDIDIFWPQNGWYRLKQRLFQPLPAFIVFSTKSRFAGSTDIPPELHEIMLRWLKLSASDGDESAMLRLHNVLIDKQSLSKFSLVCSSWAKACRPKLFHTIALRCAGDVEQLLPLLNSPSTCLPQYIIDIDIISYPLATRPWLHLLPSLYAKLEHRFQLTVQLTGPLHSAFKALHSVHYQLPRCSPTFSQQINTLELSHLHVRDFSNLIHIVGEIPELNQLKCEEVTWDILPDTLPVRRIAANRGPFFHVIMTKCTQNWAAIWIPLGLRRRRTDPYHHNFHELSDLVSLLASSAERNTNEHLSDFTISVRSISDRINISWECPMFSPSFKIVLDGSGKNVTKVEISTLTTVHFPKPAEYWERVDWGKLDELLLGLTRLKIITLFFHEEKALRHFMQEIVASRGALRFGSESRARLRYAFIQTDKDGWGKWAYVSPSNNAVEGYVIDTI